MNNELQQLLRGLKKHVNDDATEPTIANGFFCDYIECKSVTQYKDIKIEISYSSIFEEFQIKKIEDGVCVFSSTILKKEKSLSWQVLIIDIYKVIYLKKS